MNRTLRLVLGVVIVLAVAAGSFYAGTVYGQNRAQAQFTARRQGFMGQGGPFPIGTPGTPGPGGRMGGGMVFGQIEQVGEGLLVIKDNNGQQIQVHVTDTTLIEKNMSVSLNDLQEGETVLVSGTRGDDGSITARSVQVAPPGRFGGFPPPSATPAP